MIRCGSFLFSSPCLPTFLLLALSPFVNKVKTFFVCKPRKNSNIFFPFLRIIWQGIMIHHFKHLKLWKSIPFQSYFWRNILKRAIKKFLPFTSLLPHLFQFRCDKNYINPTDEMSIYYMFRYSSLLATTQIRFITKLC